MHTLPKLLHKALVFALVVFVWLYLNTVGGVAESPATSAPVVAADTPADSGRYLAIVGGCNDCHTPGWPESGGTLPEADWLTGSSIGFRGPWGTTYASNLRLLASEIDEEAWVTMLRVRQDRPPMPWMNLNRMSEADARSLYRFIHSLSVKGSRMPTALPPGVEPATPYFVFEPQHMERFPAADPGTPAAP